MNELGTKSYQARTRLLMLRIAIGLVLGIGAPIIGTDFRTHAQTTRFVSTTGDDQGGGNDCSSSGQPCSTIQNAINHSGGGDVIDLGPGAYLENVTVSQSVTIRGDSSAGSVVDGNHVESVFIINSGVSATLETLTIQNGTAQPDTKVTGGGIHNGGGNLTVIGCTITGNRAPETTVNTGPGGSTTYSGIGGGIYNVNGSLTVINSTISGNFATLSGGGIDNHDTATLINATIASNSSFNGAGGVENESVNAILNVTNTLMANNSGGDYDNFNNTGKIGTNSHNFVGRGGGIPSALSGDPLLGPLQNNGGPTFTQALAAGSPAIDAGDDSVLANPLNLTTDQRGSGFPRLGCSHVDIGAYEAHVGDPPAINCQELFAVTDPGKPTATVTLTATGEDVCGDALTPAYTIDGSPITSPHAFPVGGTNVTATVSDSLGGTASCNFFVFVHCVPPTIICPGDLSVFTDPGKTSATVTFAAAASDPCSGALTPHYSIGRTPISSPFAFPVGTTTVTATANNTGGNASCSFTVTVTCLPPTVTCPGNISVYTDPGRASATLTFAATASDACDGSLTPVYSIGNKVITSPYAFPPAITTVTVTATGSNGLTGSCSFIVNVTLLDQCIQDDHTGDTFRFNSTTGQYLYTRCKDKFTLAGTGSVRNISGSNTLIVNLSNLKINASSNPGSLTGRANITLIPATGVLQMIVVNQTNPAATCRCP